MKKHRQYRTRTIRTRKLRTSQTVSEGLLWSVLRSRQLCGLKFRRQHSIGPWIVDFACVEKMLAIEVDGGYHDHIVDRDIFRQSKLERQGWRLVRFSDTEVEDDVEAVARAIAAELGIPYAFRKRKGTGSGMRKDR